MQHDHLRILHLHRSGCVMSGEVWRLDPIWREAELLTPDWVEYYASQQADEAERDLYWQLSAMQRSSQSTARRLVLKAADALLVVVRRICERLDGRQKFMAQFVTESGRLTDAGYELLGVDRPVHVDSPILRSVDTSEPTVPAGQGVPAGADGGAA